VPAIMKWPGTIPNGTTCGSIITGMDFLPTIAYINNITLPSTRKLDGKNVYEQMKNPTKPSAPASYLYYSETGALEVIRYQNWRLFLSPKNELYNLAENIQEQKNYFCFMLLPC
jgi:arylsulfatase A-like enzyme